MFRQFRREGRLDYKWKARVRLSKMKGHLTPKAHELVYHCVSPFAYIICHQAQIASDASLQAVCQMCTDLTHVTDVEHPDQRLDYLSHLFNRLIQSDRGLLMCYDCGTVARGVFLQLIKTYREGQIRLRSSELKQIKDTYYMDHYTGTTGVRSLRTKIHQTRQNCLFLCAMQLGHDFGHIYVIEKIYVNQRPRYRIYQSCLDAFLLIDYIEAMDYAQDVSAGIDIDRHLEALQHLIGTKNWSKDDIQLFIDWYKFMPPEGTKPGDKKLFTYSSICL